MVYYFLSEDKRSPTAGSYAIAVGDFVTGGERSHFRQLQKRDERPIILKRLPCASASLFCSSSERSIMGDRHLFTVSAFGWGKSLAGVSSRVRSDRSFFWLPVCWSSCHSRTCTGSSTDETSFAETRSDRI
ncbi:MULTISPECIES: hypothetical protein [unclassified Microcoleus]|uniref:hypothetical protein n=1 Tax=unclassified Microcoleus TaxID=2642155 RepID=UPI002FCF4477